MVVAKIQWDRQALAQLRAAIVYCKKEFGIAAAHKFRQQIINDTQKLSRNPSMGKVEPMLEEYAMCYRSLVIGHIYKLIYTIRQDGTIYIQLLWDCRQDPRRIHDKI